MSDLEKIIYETALKAIPAALKKVKEINTPARRIKIPFTCEGCIDWLVYDTELERFTKIEYDYGVGPGNMNGLSSFSGHFKQIESREIAIENHKSLPQNTN